MEYTIGSVADLISGKKTPNKPKVQKLFVEKILQNPITPSSPQLHSKHKIKPKVETKKRKLLGSSTTANSDLVVINQGMLEKLVKNKPPSEETTEEPTTQQKSKKRKLEESEEPVSRKKLKKRNMKAGSVDPNPSRAKKEETEEDKIATQERNARTIFVGNIPVTIKKRQLLRRFSKYGKVESVRLRGMAPAEPGISKRLAVYKKLLHPKRLTIYGYVTFALREDALKALELNGSKYKDHHIRVQISNDTQNPDPHKAIFVGNLPFDVEDEELWTAFESCGPIISVRVVRHAATNMGIGIAYVNFESSNAVELALQMDDVKIKKNVVRINRYSQKKKHGKRHEQNKLNKKLPHVQVPNRSKNNPESRVSPNNKGNRVDLKVGIKGTAFEGSKSIVKKKKKKMNKSVLKKMKLVNKIAPK